MFGRSPPQRKHKINQLASHCRARIDDIGVPLGHLAISQDGALLAGGAAHFLASCANLAFRGYLLDLKKPRRCLKATQPSLLDQERITRQGDDAIIDPRTSPERASSWVIASHR